MLRRVCVFCGSQVGAHPVYAEQATLLGRLLVERSIGLVFGGGRIGLMGKLADAVLAAGGEVTGVIPRGLMARELAHPDVPDMRLVATMHDRKALMGELADGFIALPGGFGTLEEFFEVLTWAQLGIHQKPCGLLNVAGYYDGFTAMLDLFVRQGFVTAANRALVLTASEPAKLLDALTAYRSPESVKWLEQEQT